MVVAVALIILSVLVRCNVKILCYHFVMQRTVDSCLFTHVRVYNHGRIHSCCIFSIHRLLHLTITLTLSSLLLTSRSLILKLSGSASLIVMITPTFVTVNVLSCASLCLLSLSLSLSFPIFYLMLAILEWDSRHDPSDSVPTARPCSLCGEHYTKMMWHVIFEIVVWNNKYQERV